MDENKEPALNTEQKAKGNKATKIAVILAAILIVCVAVYFGVTKVVIPNKNYNAAVDLMNDGKYEEAITVFKALDGYKDSAEQITACKTEIKDIAYDAALAMKDEGKYEEAIAAFEALNGYKDSSEQITACEIVIKDEVYKAAVALLDEGNVIKAYESLISLNGYKDSAERAKSLYEQYKSDALNAAAVGDYIYFGFCEQDDNTTNGKESIEWLVLAKEDNKILVISRYALDAKPYNTKWEAVTWETCALRTWLNGTFLDEAFSKAEQSIIQTTKVSAGKNPDYSSDPGNATRDKVFLLSIDEANKYFATDEERMCTPTACAIANGAGTYGKYEADVETTCWWWLRSPGYISFDAAYVDICDGSVRSKGNYVSNGYGCVRPAMWISLDA